MHSVQKLVLTRNDCTNPTFSILMLLSSEKVILLAIFSSSVFVMICLSWADMDLPVRELEKLPHQRTNIREHIVTSKKGYEIFCVINWLLDKLCVTLQCLEDYWTKTVLWPPSLIPSGLTITLSTPPCCTLVRRPLLSLLLLQSKT